MREMEMKYLNEIKRNKNNRQIVRYVGISFFLGWNKIRFAWIGFCRNSFVYLVVLIFTFLNIVKYILNHITV